MAKERPLLSAAVDPNDDCVKIWVNSAGIELLAKLVADLQGGPALASEGAAFKNNQWHDVELIRSTLQKFDCGSAPCPCGCQDKYKDIEAQYQEK
jgi:hypothetical protein